MKMMDYPGVNRIFRFETGMRVSMKGCAFHLPIRDSFAKELLSLYTEFTDRVPDANRSVLQFDLLDPTVIVAKAYNKDMAFCNRGYHLNAAAEMIWQSPQSDEACRRWACDIAAIFKAELQRPRGKGKNGVTAEDSGGLENSPVMMYGNPGPRKLLIANL
ncbi:FAD binding domain-containing protein [Apiospora arundinis]